MERKKILKGLSIAILGVIGLASAVCIYSVIRNKKEWTAEDILELMWVRKQKETSK